MTKGILTLAVHLTTVFQVFAQSDYFETILRKNEPIRLQHMDSSIFKDEIILIPGKFSSDELFFDTLNGATLPPIAKIKLIYTEFPENIDPYQEKLNLSRMIRLGEKFPQITKLLPQAWELIALTGLQSRDIAAEQFHGFILYPYKVDDVPDFLDKEALSQLAEKDSTVIKVLDRNPDWENLLLVTDLTASMTPYTAQLLLWFKLNEKANKIRHFVFFNDGDQKSTAEKKIGDTGGIYHVDSESFDKVAETARLTVANGYGGDLEENNLEAVLDGIEKCAPCKEVVMIADNKSSPRDMKLLEKIGKPVRVILCGTEYGLNVDYLNIALKTGGSIHTIESDIMKLIALNEGQKLEIDGETFIIKNGSLEHYRKL